MADADGQALIPECPAKPLTSVGEEETSSRRPLRSRWDADSPELTCGDGTGGGRKRKSRWAEDVLPPAAAADLDPEVQSLNFRLVEITRVLQLGLFQDDRPEVARSPSPEPVYNNMGIRINTREYRARGKLMHERQTIISKLIQKNPAYRPPADYRPPKLHRKLYIPMKEYPGYNFIGLIIGPRGNTQKRMERETGAKIVIRGKGSVKEGRLQQKREFKHDPAENEDLHVLVEAETQDAVDKAADMVERLLQPVDEVLNEHKRQQLRELASLNGTIRDEEFCRLCGEQGHRQYACSARSLCFKSDVLCKICGDGGHPTIDCPVKGSGPGSGNKMDDEYQNFLAELGGSVPESITKQSATFAIHGSNSEYNGITDANGLKKEYDETNLYIGYLPPTLDDNGLIRLFISFGDVVMAKVIKDKITGLSKGYGFVKFSDVSMANQAISSMHGYNLEGRSIAVRVAGKPPQATVPPGSSAPAHTLTYLPSYSLQQSYTTRSARPPLGSYVGAPVPLGSAVPPPYASYTLRPPGFTMYPLPPAGSTMTHIPPPRSTMYSPHPPGSSDATQNTPPGVPTSMYGASYNASGAGMDPPVYTTSSYGYPPYFFPGSTLPPPPFHPT